MTGGASLRVGEEKRRVTRRKTRTAMERPVRVGGREGGREEGRDGEKRLEMKTCQKEE
jgi:hypothetical protein